MFNPYQQYVPQLPQQQVIQVSGKASLDTLRLAPNSSVLVMDSSAPIVWLCVSDGLGNVTPTAYDITPHVEEAAPDSIEQRLAAVEEKLKEVLYGKSNDGGSFVAKARPSKASDGHDAKPEHDASADVRK